MTLRRYAFLLVVLALILSSLACNLGSALDQDEDTNELAPPPAQEAETIDEPGGAEPSENQGTQPSGAEETTSESEPAPSATEASEVPQPPAETPDAASGEGQAVETASLTSLDSYRATWGMTVGTAEESEMTLEQTLEWVKEPPAKRLIMGQLEFVWIDDSVWANYGGAGWLQGDAQETEDAMQQFEALMDPDNDMVKGGEDTVDGVHCKWYVSEQAAAGNTVCKEICVADQTGLPPVVIKAIGTMVVSAAGETMTTTYQARVYDINTEIVIEAPQ